MLIEWALCYVVPGTGLFPLPCFPSAVSSGHTASLDSHLSGLSFHDKRAFFILWKPIFIFIIPKLSPWLCFMLPGQERSSPNPAISLAGAPDGSQPRDWMKMESVLNVTLLCILFPIMSGTFNLPLWAEGIVGAKWAYELCAAIVQGYLSLFKAIILSSIT